MDFFPFNSKSIVIVLQSIMFTIFVAAATSAQAAVYKWVDEHGKVHYSDQKRDQKASEQSVSVGTMPKAPLVVAAQPQAYGNDQPPKWLLVKEVAVALDAEDSARKNNVSFYFGGDCVSPTSISFDNFQQRYRKNIDVTADVRRILTSTLAKYGYRNNYVKDDDPKYNIQGDEGYLLRLQITAIKINACVTKLRSPQDSGMLDKFSLSSYDKSNSWLRLTWSVENGNKILASGFSDGAANDMDGQDANINSTFRQAFTSGIHNLIADPEFVKVMSPARSITDAAGRPRVESSAEPEEPKPTLKALPGKLQSSYVTRAKFAQALSLVNPVRLSVTMFYGQNGEWPNYFSDMNLDAKHLHQPGIVDAVSLRLGGKLHVKLAPETFGANQSFELTPDVSNPMAMDWICKTSLDKSLWTGPCTGY